MAVLHDLTEHKVSFFRLLTCKRKSLFSMFRARSKFVFERTVSLLKDLYEQEPRWLLPLSLGVLSTTYTTEHLNLEAFLLLDSGVLAA